MIRHQLDQLVVGHVPLAERQRRVDRFLRPQGVAWPQPRLSQQGLDLLTRQRLHVVVDPLEVHPALAQQVEQPPAGRAGRLLVDGQAGVHDAASAGSWSPDAMSRTSCPASNGSHTYGMPLSFGYFICLPSFAGSWYASEGIPRSRRARSTATVAARSST